MFVNQTKVKYYQLAQEAQEAFKKLQQNSDSRQCYRFIRNSLDSVNKLNKETQFNHIWNITTELYSSIIRNSAEVKNEYFIAFSNKIAQIIALISTEIQEVTFK